LFLLALPLPGGAGASPPVPPTGSFTAYRPQPSRLPKKKVRRTRSHDRYRSSMERWTNAQRRCEKRVRGPCFVPRPSASDSLRVPEAR
jgi:hypothetical protein